MGLYRFLWLFMCGYGCHGRLWGFMDRCLWTPIGVYGFLGVYGCLWVFRSMDIYGYYGCLCVLHLNIQNVAYSLIHEPQKIWEPQKTSEITHVSWKTAYVPRGGGFINLWVYRLVFSSRYTLACGTCALGCDSYWKLTLINKVSFLPLGA